MRIDRFLSRSGVNSPGQGGYQLIMPEGKEEIKCCDFHGRDRVPLKGRRRQWHTRTGWRLEDLSDAP
jgi:hypothetical protein